MPTTFLPRYKTVVGRFARNRNSPCETMRDLGIEKLANPLIGVNYRASLGSANSFNDLPPLPAAPSNKWTKNVPAHEASTRHHVADTFKAQGDHFQGLREPLSRPKFHPLRRPANGHWCVRMRGQGNGYGRHCDHNLRRALSCTPPDVAGLFSTGYLTVPHRSGLSWVRGMTSPRSPDALIRQRPLKNTPSTRQGVS